MKVSRVGTKVLSKLPLLLALLPATIFASVAPSAIASFHSTNGASPIAGLVLTSSGNLYGSTYSGGKSNGGVVFVLDENGVFATLHDFSPDDQPSSGLTLRRYDGILYGTTFSGGTFGRGTVFTLTTNGVFKNITTFNGANGAHPSGELVEGADGNFYGVTTYGGTRDDGGTVFKLTFNGTVSVLHSFNSISNGCHPFGGLALGPDASLYGTTRDGGPNNAGTVFKISPSNLEFSPLYSFTGGNDGAYPMAAMTWGTDGLLYGTTRVGGTNHAASGGVGTIFRIDTNGAFNTMVSFNGTNGALPFGKLLQSKNGGLIGTCYAGGIGFTGEPSSGFGTVFKLYQDGLISRLCAFDIAAGARPRPGVVEDPQGILYGTTFSGGMYGLGTIYKLVLPDPPRLRSIAVVNGKISLNWASVPNQAFQLQFKESLSDESWRPVGTNIVANGLSTTVFDAIGQ